MRKIQDTGAKIGLGAKISHRFEISAPVRNFTPVPISTQVRKFRTSSKFCTGVKFRTVRNFALVRKLRTCAKISHLCSKFFASVFANFARLQSPLLILISYLKASFDSESSCSERLKTKISNKMPIWPSC